MDDTHLIEMVDRTRYVSARAHDFSARDRNLLSESKARLNHSYELLRHPVLKPHPL